MKACYLSWREPYVASMKKRRSKGRTFSTQSARLKAKWCSLIIDGGSCTNVVSLSMVDKLNLQAMTHPHPYNIHGVNQSKGIQVNFRCLISFSIGTSYQDELWFDIIPTDTCHIMFGRPWLFDRKVIHDGYLNTYSFSKEGKKVTLVPTPPSQLLKPPNAPPTNLLLEPYPQIESYHTLHPPLTHSIRAYNPVVQQKIPHDIFPHRALLSEVDLLHEPNEDLLSLRTNSK